MSCWPSHLARSDSSTTGVSTVPPLTRLLPSPASIHCSVHLEKELQPFHVLLPVFVWCVSSDAINCHHNLVSINEIQPLSPNVKSTGHSMLSGMTEQMNNDWSSNIAHTMVRATLTGTKKRTWRMAYKHMQLHQTATNASLHRKIICTTHTYQSKHQHFLVQAVTI